jgi:dienelactone hydrolase
MRPFELILSILTILTGIIKFIPNIPKKYRSLLAPFLLVLGTAAQIALEGFRWQLWPLFLAILGLIAHSLVQMEKKGDYSLLGLSVLFAAISLSLGFLAPVPNPYPITGPYPVGTREIHLVDSQRVEIYGENPNAPREIMVQIWYPAAPDKSDQQAGWMPGITSAAPAIADKLNLPAFTLSHLKYVKANAFWEAAPAVDEVLYPVLIFSHGWEGFKEQNIYQVEELASHGYVVVGINHTYGAIHTLFPDGRQVGVNHDALPDGVSDEAYDQASDILSRQWVEDIDLVLDKLANWNQQKEEWFLAESLDLEKVGVLGHSTGGGAAVRFCLTDVRCQAVLGMDPWVEPAQIAVRDIALRKPAMLLYSETWNTPDEEDRNPDLLRELVNKANNTVIEITIEGTRHYDFSSLPMLSPLTITLGLKGPINGQLVLEIINAETVAFFDRYLRGDQTINLEGISQRYPEVLFEIKP